MNDTRSNAFHSSLVQIVLEDNDGGETGNRPTFSYDIMARNPECEFHRLEMEENVFEIYPVGALILRDKKDILSFIKTNQVTNVKLVFQNATDKSYINLSVTSTSYVTNAASDTEQNFVSINVSNYFYKYSQKSSLIKELNVKKPQVHKTSDFISKISREILDVKFSNSKPTLRTCDPTDNFILYRPLNPNGHHLESASDNTFQYLMYLSTLATGKDTKNPRFMFWTEFGNTINFKYFPETPLQDRQAILDKLDSFNFKYAVYSGDVPQQKFTVDNSNVTFKKIYTISTDPADQYVSKNYYYIRSVPKFLDNNPKPGNAASTEYLTLFVQDDGLKNNTEIIASSGAINGITAGSDELRYESEWGYHAKYMSPNHDNGSLISTEYGVSPKYALFNYMGATGFMNYVDSGHMWKNIFDFTPVSPNYPLPPTGNPNTFNLQKIIDIRYQVLSGNNFSNKNLELIRKIEKQNFILYTLCCMGEDTEDSFFAELIQYRPDQNAKTAENGKGLKFRYRWKGLKYTTKNTTGNDGGTYYTDVENWEYDPNLQSTEGVVINGKTYPDSTWAINLNERTAGLGTPDYYPPGWVSSNLPSGFKYRPVGAYDTTFNPEEGTISHIVRMYRVSADKLLVDSGVEVPYDLIGAKMYYFTVENIVDGTCS
jgi:hypothetical protein